MDIYISQRGRGLSFMLFMALLYNVLILVLLRFTDSYIVDSLLKLILISCNIYLTYYMLLSTSLKCTIDDQNLKISAMGSLKKVIIPLNEIEGYTTSSGTIKGVKLYGIASNSFAIGRTVIDKIGISRMFVTDNKKIFHIKTKDMNYAVSPHDYEKFEETLIYHDVHQMQWKYKVDENYKLHKDKHFILPFIVVSVIILILTLNPLILYLKQSLPSSMPLNFDARFNQVEMGTGKQFAFTQMIYGVLNMVLLFCMYYASHFCAKYDRKSAYKYIYISLIVATVFLFIQFKILINFR
jgi:hypothetical protein